MNTVVYIISILIVFSKFLDCWTTSIQIVDPSQERNPIARNLFKRFGSQKVIWGIFGLTILIVVISLWCLFTIYNTNIYKALYLIIGLIVTMAQFAVAYTNKTRKLNIATRILMKRYSKNG